MKKTVVMSVVSAAVFAIVLLKCLINLIVTSPTAHNSGEIAPLRWKASNNEIPGLALKEEGDWTSFFYVHGADTQLGLIDEWNNVTNNPGWEEELRRLGEVVKKINAMQPKPKFFLIGGDLVNSFPQTAPYPSGTGPRVDDEFEPTEDVWRRQAEDFLLTLSTLDASVPVICVGGNHDQGNTPTTATIQKYRSLFGDDFFSFWSGGSLFIVLNSQLYKDPDLVPRIAQRQEEWLDAVLTSEDRRTARHVIAFMHIAPFRDDVDEEEQWFNLPVRVRRPLLNKLFDAGVRKIFCGHYHQNAGGFYVPGGASAFDGKLEIVITSAIGRVWAGGPGVRIVKLQDDISHRFFNISDIPTRNEM